MKTPRTARRGISTLNLLVGGVLWTAVLIAAGLLAGSARTVRNDDESQNPGANDAGSGSESSVKIGFPAKELPDFEFPECEGGTVSRDSLKGHPWVASFVFTRCRTTCPMITREVMELHRRLSTSNPDVKFVTFSVDSSYDTAEVLQKYSEIFSADPKRWKFLTGDELQIHDLIRRGFTLYVAPNLGEERKPGFEVAHTNRVVLVNEDSIPVATFLATNPDDMAKLRQILQGKAEFPKPGPSLSFTITNSSDQPAGELGLQLKVVPSSQDTEPKSDPAEPPSHTKNGNEQPKNEKQPEDAGDQLPEAESVAPGSEPADPETINARHPSEIPQVLNDRIEELLPEWAKKLPSVNAGLNSLSTILLLSGFAAIRAGKRQTHRNLMISAFVVSVAFLACYLTYHYALGEYTGERGRRFVGSETASLVYKAILFPHVILAVFVPFLAIRVFQHAFRQDWQAHRRLAVITFPIWLFVSVTGVVIYLMLYQWPWRTVAQT